MAHKDFVKRGKAPTKKKTTSKKAPPKPSVPWLRIVVTILLVAAFGYFLWAISHNAELPTPESAETPVALPEKAEEQDVLPEMPEDEYLYPSELAQGNVEIEMREQQKSDRPYLMQCGSFRQQQQADKMRAQLAMQGLESQVRASNGKNGRWYRVILGPYDYKRDAETDRHVIQRIGISTCQVWYWNL